MRKVRAFVLVWGVLAAGVATAAPPAGEGADPALAAVARRVQAWGKDPVFVKAVTAQNARKVPLAEVQSIDKAWIANPGVDARMTELMSSPCAVRLKELVSADPAFGESFVMDDQGANVCMTQKTSDYWQGDEAKWQKSFAGGRGALFIDKPRYDTSAKAILAQISVPVTASGKAIGAITVGVNVDTLRAHEPQRKQ